MKSLKKIRTDEDKAYILLIRGIGESLLNNMISCDIEKTTSYSYSSCNDSARDAS